MESAARRRGRAVVRVIGAVAFVLLVGFAVLALAILVVGRIVP